MRILSQKLVDVCTRDIAPPPHGDSLISTIQGVLAYCQASDWAGYDPYDALNSAVFRNTPLNNLRFARLLFTQLMRRSPVNLRTILQVPKTPNPKAVALSVSALAKLRRSGYTDGEMIVDALVERLLAMRSEKSSYPAWGYNFEWQSRTGLFPRGLPNIICTTFAGNALLDAMEQARRSHLLPVVTGAAEFLLKALYFEEKGGYSCFNYTPIARSKVHNANLLGAAFLARVSAVTGDRSWLEPAIRAAEFSVTKQHKNGAWDYGEAPYQRWKDNFHTGFNLCALRSLGEYAGTHQFEHNVQKGFEFYIQNFFTDGGLPKYFHDRTYPVDIHSIAQSIITCIHLRDLRSDNISRAREILDWTMRNMWDNRGFFYFQKSPYFTNKIPYIRWSCAWMLLAMAYLWEAECGLSEGIRSSDGCTECTTCTTL